VELSPGQTICDRFELVREEPEGTGTPVLGTRWAAFDLDSGDLVRLVFIGPELGGDGARRAALEARLAALTGLREDSLAPVCFVGVEAGASVVAYEGLYGGIAVAEVFGDLSAEERGAEHVRFAVELARGLRALHRGGLLQAIHGIEVVFDWERGYALWCYGLADVCEPAVIRARCREQGLALAPEVAAGGPFTRRADVFGWAASVAAFVTGLPPAEAIESARSGGISGVDERLQALLLRCLAASPTQRPEGGEDLVRGLATAGLTEEDGAPEDVSPEVASPEPAAQRSAPELVRAEPAPVLPVLPPAADRGVASPPTKSPVDLAIASTSPPQAPQQPSSSPSVLDGIAGLELPMSPEVSDLLDLPPLPPLPGHFSETSAGRSGLSSVSSSVDAALGLGPATTIAEPEKKRADARPAPAVIVKAPAKPAPSPPSPSGQTGKIRVLGAPLEPARAENKGATEAPSTASLVSAALAAGRVTPPSMAPAGKAGVVAEAVAEVVGAAAQAPTQAVKRDADAASPRATPGSAKVAVASTEGREPDAPVLRRDRRTHPLGWAIQSEPVAVATATSAELAAQKAAAEASSSGLVDTQAIVEATSVPVQPGAGQPVKDKSSYVQLFLLFLAASLLILAILIYGS